MLKRLAWIFLLSNWIPLAWAQAISAPTIPFWETLSPPAPNYSSPQYWAALPDRADFADLVPLGSIAPDRQDTANVDAFYIHPTTYNGSENWNQDLEMREVNLWTDTSVIARQASVFNACCKVYAPRYRQAALGVGTAMERGGSAAYKLAYKDVAQAWHHYIENWNSGRPFVIVGHSQGAMHARQLLVEEIAGTPVADRLIAAYIIGIPLAEGYLAPIAESIPVCSGELDTGCLLSWNTFDRKAEVAARIERAKASYRNFTGTDQGQEIVCWAPTSRNDGGNTGALPGNPKDKSLVALVDGPRASCQDGVLWTDTPTNEQFHLTLPGGGNLHYHDFDLFYEDIRLNALDRARAYLKQQK